jgi:hypothetical protein
MERLGSSAEVAFGLLCGRGLRSNNKQEYVRTWNDEAFRELKSGKKRRMHTGGQRVMPS